MMCKEKEAPALKSSYTTVTSDSWIDSSTLTIDAQINYKLLIKNIEICLIISTTNNWNKCGIKGPVHTWQNQNDFKQLWLKSVELFCFLPQCKNSLIRSHMFAHLGHTWVMWQSYTKMVGYTFTNFLLASVDLWTFLPSFFCSWLLIYSWRIRTLFRVR